MRSCVELRVLGPLELVVDDRPVNVGGPQVRAVLALLAAEAGRVVSLAKFVTQLWGEHAPPDAERTVRTYVSRLRRTVPPELILTRPPGYQLVDPGIVDATRFERLAAAGREAARAEQLAAALGLWHGDAYAEFDGVPALRAEGQRLQRLRHNVIADRIDADLAAGRGSELIAELEGLTASHPRHERLWGQLMTALYRSGRQADALDAFRRARRTLIDDCGVEPSPKLIEIHQQILAQAPQLQASQLQAPQFPASQFQASQLQVSPPQASLGGPRPAQLPPAVPTFTGRHTEIAALTALADQGRSTTIIGTAGVGKTALAVQWAHQVAGRFPDGQLYVNLRGFDPSGSVMSPAEAVRGFLDALDVSAARLPVGLDAQVALFRSLVADRRMLIVLDNARDAEQVRALIPGSAACLVLITSRNQLSGLVAAEGVHPLALDVLSYHESRQLLARRLGVHRIDAEPRAVDDIIIRCVQLPLALAIVAARAVTYPRFPLRALANELGENQARLDALGAGDPATELRTVFSWSFNTLSPGAARLFRLLGRHPGPDISTAAATSLAHLPAAQTRRLLGELTSAHLIVEHIPGRFGFHDLLRSYAAELRDSDDASATHRMLDHYLHTARAAAMLLNPHRDPVTIADPQPGVTPERLTDHQQALVWFGTEHRVLLAVMHDSESDVHTWQLAWTLHTFLNRQGHWSDWAEAWQVALAATRRLADTSAQATAHRSLGWAYTLLGSYDLARTHLGHALDLYAKAGDRVGHADIHLDLGRALVFGDRNAEGLQHAHQALELYRAADHRAGQALALNNIGWCQTVLGEHRQGLAACEQALALHRELGNQDGEAGTLDSLGLVYHHLGEHHRAIASYRLALDLYRDLGDRYEEAATLTNLGATLEAAGDLDDAHDAWKHALAILEDLDHPDAGQVRARLHHSAGGPL